MSRRKNRGDKLALARELSDAWDDNAQALEFQIKLAEAIRQAQKFKYDCPKPLVLSGHDEVFAKCEGARQGQRWSGEVAGWEIVYDNVIQIRDWCQSVLAYLDKNKVKKDYDGTD